MVVQALGQTQLGAGLTSYLAGLHGHPVRCGGRTGLDGGLGLLGIGEQPQPQRRQLCLAAGQLDQRGPLLGRGHREQRHLGQAVQTTREPARELGHRVPVIVLVVDYCS